MKDKYNLERFIKAQSGIYKTVVSELKKGQKRTHWMWFIFPQIIGLGFSSLSIQYSISSLKEAEVYLNNQILGGRLRECTRILLSLDGYSAKQIFGSIDVSGNCTPFRFFNYCRTFLPFLEEEFL